LVLGDGRYELGDTLDLGPDDSGLEIRAGEGATPVLSGGRRLTGWVQDPANAEMWRVTLPEVREGRWYFQQLFVNGVRAQRARTPNTNFFRARGPLGGGPVLSLPFRAGDLKPQWADLPDVRLVMLQKWTDLHLPIRTIHADQNTAEFPGGPRPDWMTEPDARYWVETVPDALDIPGEWYLDRRTGVLSLLAEAGTDPNKASVVAPRLTVLVRVRGDEGERRPVTHLTFRGLTLAETDYDMPAQGMISPQAAVRVPGAFRVEFATDGVVEDCLLENLGGYAMDLGRGAQRWRIQGNEIRSGGAGGIRLGETGERKPDDFTACRAHDISDNHLHALGRVFAPAVGVIVFQSGDNQITHNHIHDLFYTAISVGWNWGYQETPCRGNIIEYNHLHDIGQGRLSDMGGVYTLGIQPGTRVRNNVIHDVVSYDYGGWGLYTDEGSTGILLESNVVYRCKSAGFHQHYGRENTVRNNIFAFNRENQWMRSREEEHISFFLTNNVVCYDSGNLLGSTWKNDRFVIERNLYFDTRIGADPNRMNFAGVTWDQWRVRGHDTNSVVADPLFIDAAKDDYRLQPGSPAWKLGFQAIDVSTVGPRNRKTSAPGGTR
jgi:parallel beta-helix repeat protein